mmetsp:Transcript_37353/g.106699  ORF Transcript_37353/g.106699 Transcript_37353/m.106699 type:complete len:624 (+) Transcript_37353:71-1942(+)
MVQRTHSGKNLPDGTGSTATLCASLILEVTRVLNKHQEQLVNRLDRRLQDQQDVLENFLLGQASAAPSRVLRTPQANSSTETSTHRSPMFRSLQLSPCKANESLEGRIIGIEPSPTASQSSAFMYQPNTTLEVARPTTGPGDNAQSQPDHEEDATEGPDTLRLRKTRDSLDDKAAAAEGRWKFTSFGSSEEAPDSFPSNRNFTLDAAASRRSFFPLLTNFVHGNHFEGMVSLLILSNALFFGIEAEYMASNGLVDPPFGFQVVSQVYSVLFVIELLLRVSAEGTYFCVSPSWAWNCFDTLIVLASFLELILSVVANARVKSLVSIRVLRVVRTIRLLRVVRVMKGFRSLRVLVYSVVNTLRSLMWTMLLLLAILYLFGIMFTQAATQQLAQHDSQDVELKKYYGSLFRSIFTLFKSMTGGLDWQEAVDPLSSVSPVWMILFMAFISFTYFAVLNVVTGVFCQTAIESATLDQDMVVQDMLASKKEFTTRFAQIFKHIDTDDTGKITLAQFEDGLKDEQVQAYFASMELTIDEAFSLFTLLDTDGTHVIDIDAFVTGCLRLRGNAKAIDIAMLMYQSRVASQVSIRTLSTIRRQMRALVDLAGRQHQAQPLEAEEKAARELQTL